MKIDYQILLRKNEIAVSGKLRLPPWFQFSITIIFLPTHFSKFSNILFFKNFMNNKKIEVLYAQKRRKCWEWWFSTTVYNMTSYESLCYFIHPLKILKNIIKYSEIKITKNCRIFPLSVDSCVLVFHLISATKMANPSGFTSLPVEISKRQNVYQFQMQIVSHIWTIRH